MDVVLYQAGVRSLADVVVVDPTGADMTDSNAHIPGHVVVKAAQLKEEASAACFSGDPFFPSALEVFWALHTVLDQFLYSSATLVVECQHPPLVLVVTAFF